MTITPWYQLSRILRNYTGTISQIIPGCYSGFRSVRFRSEGNHQVLASGSWDGVVQLWNISESRQPIWTSIYHRQEVFGLSFLPNSQSLISVSESALNWPLEHSTGIRIDQTSVEISSASFSRNGEIMALANWKEVRIWNLLSNRSLAIPPNQSSSDIIRVVVN